MHENTFSLPGALAMSLLLHGALLAVGWWFAESAKHNSPRAASHTLSAVLKVPPPPRVAPPPPQPPLRLPNERRSASPVERAPQPISVAKPRETGAPTVLARQALAEVKKHLLYPPEAVAQGLEGETLVMIFLDESGAVVAARVERGSGHDILDQAAVTAARQVRSLPAEGAREVLVPVRFRLQ